MKQVPREPVAIIEDRLGGERAVPMWEIAPYNIALESAERYLANQAIQARNGPVYSGHLFEMAVHR